jgi:hypothetical protein
MAIPQTPITTTDERSRSSNFDGTRSRFFCSAGKPLELFECRQTDLDHHCGPGHAYIDMTRLFRTRIAREYSAAAV